MVTAIYICIYSVWSNEDTGEVERQDTNTHARERREGGRCFNRRVAAAAQEINTGEVPCFLCFISNQSQHSSEEEEEEEEEGDEGLPHG